MIIKRLCITNISLYKISIYAIISGVYGAQQYIFCNLIISLVLLGDNKKEKGKKKNELYNIR